jgi:hypothetical protein
MIVSVGIPGSGTLQITSNICPEFVKEKELGDIENVPFVKCPFFFSLNQTNDKRAYAITRLRKHG